MHTVHNVGLPQYTTSVDSKQNNKHMIEVWGILFFIIGLKILGTPLLGYF